MFFPSVSRSASRQFQHEPSGVPKKNITVIYYDEENVPLEKNSHLNTVPEMINNPIRVRINDDDCAVKTRISNEFYSKRQSFISNPTLLDSMSSLDFNTQRTIIRLITVFSIFFFVICFAMIAFTLRYSSYVDAKIRESYSGVEEAINYNATFNVLDIRIKPSNKIELELIRRQYKAIHDLNMVSKTNT